MTTFGANRRAHRPFRSILDRRAQYHTATARKYTARVAETFGERLRALRMRRHLTPSALAHAVGVTEGAIRQMESGQTKSASFVTGLRLAHSLGVTPWFLATGRDVPPETESPSAERTIAALERLSLQITAIDRRVKALEGRRRAGTRRRGQE